MKQETVDAFNKLLEDQNISFVWFLAKHGAHYLNSMKPFLMGVPSVMEAIMSQVNRKDVEYGMTFQVNEPHVVYPDLSIDVVCDYFQQPTVPICNDVKINLWINVLLVEP
jgi:hypothetical protein